MKSGARTIKHIYFASLNIYRSRGPANFLITGHKHSFIEFRPLPGRRRNKPNTGFAVKVISQKSRDLKAVKMLRRFFCKFCHEIGCENDQTYIFRFVKYLFTFFEQVKISKKR
jgi:hypothetical protein